MAKLAEKTGKVLAYLQEFDFGEGVSIEQIAEAMGLEEKQVRPCITLGLAAKKDGTRGALARYEKRADKNGGEKPVGYAVLTDEGAAYVDADEATV